MSMPPSPSGAPNVPPQLMQLLQSLPPQIQQMIMQLPPQILQEIAANPQAAIQQFLPMILQMMGGGGGSGAGGGGPPGMPSPGAYTGNTPPQPPAQGMISPDQEELNEVSDNMGR